MCCMYTVYSGMQEWVIQIPSIPILVSVLFPSLHLKYFRIKFLLLVALIMLYSAIILHIYKVLQILNFLNIVWVTLPYIRISLSLYVTFAFSVISSLVQCMLEQTLKYLIYPSPHHSSCVTVVYSDMLEGIMANLA